MVVGDSLFAMVVVANGDVAGRGVDRHLERLLEGWSLLYEVVAQQREMPTLGEDGGFIIQRAVLEVEHETAGDAIAPSVLNQIAVRQHTPLR